MRRSVKSNIYFKHNWWGSVSILIIGMVVWAPSAGAEQATLKLQIVPPDCQVSQVIENGETVNVFTPTGCDKVVQPTSPTPPPATPTSIILSPPSEQSGSVMQLLLLTPTIKTPASAPTSTPAVQPRTQQHTAPTTPSASAAVASKAVVASTVLGVTAAVVVGVGIAIGIHSVATTAAAAGSLSVGAVGVTRRAKKKKPRADS